MNSAVLLIVFNRPIPTRTVFEAIRQARPPRLYIAADGARAGRADDFENVRAVREIVAAVDWPCALTTLLRDENLGCKRAVSGAVDWFFEHEPEGVILEDDCLPVAGYFDYCDALLERFRDDRRIAQICGSSFVDGPDPDKSYYFSKYADIWGWASWRRSWRLADMTMRDWPAWRDAGGLGKLVGSTPAFVASWTRIFDAVHAGEIDTWDYQWMFTCWRNGLLSVIPASSQIDNIGWGEDATHTSSATPAYARPARPLPSPLRHNDEIELSLATERRIAQVRYFIDGLSEAALIAGQIPILRRVSAAIAKKLAPRLRGIG